MSVLKVVWLGLQRATVTGKRFMVYATFPFWNRIGYKVAFCNTDPESDVLWAFFTAA